MFSSSTTDSTSENDEPRVIPQPPLSPMKKAEEIEAVLNQYDDNESKLIALAQIIKKDRKKNKTLKQALALELQKNEKLGEDINQLTSKIDKYKEEVEDKDARIVKTYQDYMSTYEALIELRNGKANTERSSRKNKKEKKTNKKAKKDENEEKDIFDEFIESKATKAPRLSTK